MTADRKLSDDARLHGWAECDPCMNEAHYACVIETCQCRQNLHGWGSVEAIFGALAAALDALPEVEAERDALRAALESGFHARDLLDAEVDGRTIAAALDALAEVEAERDRMRAALTTADTLADAAEQFIDAVDNYGDVVLTGGLCADALAAYREGRRD